MLLLSKLFPGKWHLTLHVLPFVAAIVSAKYIVNHYGFEVLSLSPLVGAIISANVFLVGFLISGVLSDYKESERLPGELACSLEALADEGSIVSTHTKSPVAADMEKYVYTLVLSVLDWFHKKERTVSLLNKVTALNAHFLAFEPLTQANFIVRMKQEQNNIRKIITRIHTIREADFNQAGYAIAEIISSMLCIGLIFTRIDPYYESVFFVAFVSFILIYMVKLIKNLDNPFSHYEDYNMVDNVSLKALYNLEARLKETLRLQDR